MYLLVPTSYQRLHWTNWLTALKYGMLRGNVFCRCLNTWTAWTAPSISTVRIIINMYITDHINSVLEVETLGHLSHVIARLCSLLMNCVCTSNLRQASNLAHVASWQWERQEFRCNEDASVSVFGWSTQLTLLETDEIRITEQRTAENSLHLEMRYTPGEILRVNLIRRSSFQEKFCLISSNNHYPGDTTAAWSKTRDANMTVNKDVKEMKR